LILLLNQKAHSVIPTLTRGGAAKFTAASTVFVLAVMPKPYEAPWRASPRFLAVLDRFLQSFGAKAV
jgi:hypothetical protein